MKIRMDTPEDGSCNLAVIQDSKGNVIAYVATTKTVTQITLERAGERIGCTIEDVTPPKNFFVINPHTLESVGEGQEFLEDAIRMAEFHFPLGDAPIHDENDNEVPRPVV